MRIGITHGDINGVSYEMILKTLSAPSILDFCTPVIFGSAQAARATEQTLTLEEPIHLNIIKSTDGIRNNCINLIEVCTESVSIEWGQHTEASLQAEAASLNAALEAWKNKQVDALVAAPGQLDNDLDNHSLSDFIRKAIQAEKTAFDWIINGSLHTLAIKPIASTTELGEGLATEAFLGHITSASQQLRQDYRLIRPRIAVLSHDPKMSIQLNDLREQGILTFGPFNAETFLAEGHQQHYDGIIFIEEDNERHNLFGTLPKEDSIGYAAGLPLVLTYPIHSVAYQEAGKNMTDETPMRKAIYEAIDICRNREVYAEATRHPLEKHWTPKGRDDFKLDLTKEE